MKAVNFWKTLFCAALAITAFTACSDDDDDNGNQGMPEIKVNDKSSVVVARDLTAGETSPAVTVVSKGDWVLTFDNQNDAQWITPSQLSGKTGTATLNFNVSQASAARQATVTLTATSTYEGIPITKKATITVMQNESGSTEVETNVKAIRTLLKAMNPGQDKVDVTAEIAAMTITGVVVSDFEGHNFGNDYNIAVQDSQVSENSGLTLNANKFPELKLSAGDVVTIPLTGAKVNTYGGVIQVGIDNNVEIKTSVGTAPEPVVVTPNEVLNYESMLVKIENCMPAAGVAGTAWNNATNKGNANFTTTAGQAFVVRTGTKAAYKDALIPDKSGFLIGIGGQFNGDVQISPRMASDLAGLDKDIPAPAYQEVTINNLGVGNYLLKNTTIAGVHQKGVMFAQEVSGTVYYVLGFNNDWQTQTANPYIGDVDKLATEVKATSALRYGIYQLSNFNVTVGAASSLQLPAAVTFDAAAINSYIADPVYKYVKVVGTLDIDTSNPDYKTYTINIAGVTDKTITFAYGLDSYYNGLADGDVVEATGFALGYDNNNAKLNIMLRSIQKNTTVSAVNFTTDPTTFAATDPQQQTLAYTVANASATDVTFSIEGANADKFAVVSKTDANVVVKANGNNESDAAYKANLVAKIGEVTKATVELEQAAPKSGDDTKGIYTWMSGLYTDGQYDSKADYWYFNSKVIPNGGDDEVTALRLGKSKFSGVYTTPVLGVTGNKKLSFYAVGWTGIPSTVYVRVNNGGSVSGSPVSVAANSGYSGNPPFKITLNDSDYYTMDLKDLTATSTLSISTSPNFEGVGDAANKSRAAIIGLQIY